MTPADPPVVPHWADADLMAIPQDARLYARLYAEKYAARAARAQPAPADPLDLIAKLDALIDCERRARLGDTSGWAPSISIDDYKAIRAALATKPAELANFLPQEERRAVASMAEAMTAKLYAKYLEGYSGFEDATAEHLSALLRKHVEKGDPVDVANFCAFLHANGQRITGHPTESAGKSPEAVDTAEAWMQEALAIGKPVAYRAMTRNWGTAQDEGWVYGPWMDGLDERFEPLYTRRKT